MSTISGWASVAYAAVDATDVDMQPIRDKFPYRVWFFMLFILFGSYLVMNLFVGVIIDNFKEVSRSCVYLLCDWFICCWWTFMIGLFVVGGVHDWSICGW